MQAFVKASTWEYQAAVFGAGFVGFGLGFLLAGTIGRYSLLVMLFGIALHGWGMYAINRRSGA